MKNLFKNAAFLTLTFGSMAINAQNVSDQVQVGPIALTHQFQGVSVSPSVTSFFSLSTKTDGIYLSARIESDLGDLQQKFGALVDTVPLPKNNCGSYSGNNPVVSLPTKQLISSNNSATIKLGGEVKMWDCRENPIPEVYWDSTGCKGSVLGVAYSFGCPKTRAASPIKNVLVTQPIDFALPLTLQKTGNRSIALVLGDPTVNLSGPLAFITNGALKIAGVDISTEAKKALDKAIDPNALAVSIPKEYADLNPSIQNVRFGEKNGRMTIFLEMSAKVPTEKLNEIVKGMIHS